MVFVDHLILALSGSRELERLWTVDGITQNKTSIHVSWNVKE